MRVKNILVVGFLVLSMTGCATGKYHWGDYEDALYKYYKSPAELKDFAEELAELISDGEKDGNVPPGMYAEFGYVYLVQGKSKEAIIYFNKEKKLWPESARLMDIMIKGANSSKGKTKKTMKHQGGSK